MLLIDLTWTIQADRERAFRDALLRREARSAATRAGASSAAEMSSDGVPSGEVARVALGDRAGRLGETRPDIGGLQDLNPASGS